jgi:molecular chaperone DnaK
VDGIKAAIDDLSKASHKQAEQLYAQKSRENADGAAQDAGRGSPQKDDDVVDADYTEVK